MPLPPRSTDVVGVDPDRPDEAIVRETAHILARGGLVALPTETVYGLAACADEPAAVSRVFEAKGRPATNPLIVHVASLAAARDLAEDFPPAAESLAARAWPGPLTLVVRRRRERVPDVVTGGGPTVALRVPAHPVMLAVLHALGRPLAAPSANRFQTLSPTTAAHVLRSLDGRIERVLDAGPTAHGLESTVVDATTTPPRVLRPGPIPLDLLREWLGADVTARDARVDEHEGPLPSPGMLRRHYAPATRLVVVRADALEEALRSLGPNAAVMTRRARALGGRRVVALPDDPVAYGAMLFAALHRLDDEGHEVLVVEAVPDDEAWAAVRDRLSRAES
ncbi:MAG: threonylcarbamoyl-AMP synthase [Deltaproteobacteria bacterium]|nr:threonylcarbamoyl-AMP synthase [Deltaproteobacteria bacterium]